MIRGKRIYFRGLEREDLKLMHRWLNDEEIMEWARSKPDHLASMESLEREYELDLRGENPKRRTFIVMAKDEEKPIGFASIRWWRPMATTADIGLVIADKDLRGKGLGAEATMMLLRLAFDQYNMHKVELWTRGDNVAAQNVAKRCGFREEGRFRETVYFNGSYHDGLLFGILRDEYERIKERSNL